MAHLTRCRYTPGFCCILALFGCGLMLTGVGRAQGRNDWLEPFPAFTIAGNLHYVGSKGLASYLVTTPKGHILLNASLEANVPLISKSVEDLGFKFSDIKILLISHAHWDHNAGCALVKEQTGATYAVMVQDVAVVESGGRADFHYGRFPGSHYPSAKVDRVLHDGDTVELGVPSSPRISRPATRRAARPGRSLSATRGER